MAGVDFADAAFSPDGSILAIAVTADRVRQFSVVDWSEVGKIAAAGRIDALAFRPDSGQRLPVLFVHGHSRNSAAAWFDPGLGTARYSKAAALAKNPQLGLGAFYLELPLQGGGYQANRDRGIEMDAEDILAAIEGGPDSRGQEQVGILNLPAYRDHGRVAIIGYSHGSISSRYYIKYLMGTRMPGAVTVSEFVTLAAPNHGAGSLLVCGDLNEPDKALRQLCGGLCATNSSTGAPCSNCPSGQPPPFTTNQSGDSTFLINLNGHDFADSCNANFSHPAEAPHSRVPTNSSFSDGVLYVNLYAANNADTIVGGHTEAGDCVGRLLARNHAPDAVNMEITDTPGFLGPVVHTNFPHHWPTICVALHTVANHHAPTSQQDAIQNMVRP